MPLSVECSCSADAANCILTSLTLHIEVSDQYVGTPPVSASQSVSIFANKSDPTAPAMVLPTSVGKYDIDLPIADWAANWATISVELTTYNTLIMDSTPPFSSYELFRAQYRIDQGWTCLNVDTSKSTGWVVKSYTAAPDPDTRCEPSAGDVRVLCFAGRGVNSVFYKSRPLASCNGCTIDDHDFEPKLDGTAQIDPQASGQICFCATGGSGDYTYTVVDGNLPSGQTLNSSTGCVDGEADGVTPGSTTITIRVEDHGGGGAPVGTSRTIGGTGYLNGSNFTWASGADFFAGMVGTPMTIGGATHTVLTVPDKYHLTI